MPFLWTFLWLTGFVGARTPHPAHDHPHAHTPPSPFFCVSACVSFAAEKVVENETEEERAERLRKEAHNEVERKRRQLSKMLMEELKVATSR